MLRRLLTMLVVMGCVACTQKPDPPKVQNTPPTQNGWSVESWHATTKVAHILHTGNEYTARCTGRIDHFPCGFIGEFVGQTIPDISAISAVYMSTLGDIEIALFRNGSWELCQ